MIRALAPREKALLGVLGLVLFTWAVVALAWSPLQARRAAIAARLPLLEQALARVASPLSLAAESAAPFGLTLDRQDPRGQALDLRLDDAPFDALVLWLEALQRDHGLRITALTLTRSTTPGHVTATLTLER